VRKIALVFAAAGTAALATGCATRPDPVPPVPIVDPASPLAAPTYMRMAASGDLFEIQSSQLALQMSSNPAVRGFAQMLISDHTRMSSQMISAAQSAGLMPPPPALEPHHQQMLDQLRMAAPGSRRSGRSSHPGAPQPCADAGYRPAGTAASGLSAAAPG